MHFIFYHLIQEIMTIFFFLKKVHLVLQLNNNAFYLFIYLKTA
jgi:hypothetical protein